MGREIRRRKKKKMDEIRVGNLNNKYRFPLNRTRSEKIQPKSMVKFLLFCIYINIYTYIHKHTKQVHGSMKLIIKLFDFRGIDYRLPVR